MQDNRTSISWPPKEADIKNLNDMLTNMWSKVYGNLDFKNLSGNVNQQLYTYPIPIKGEANFDQNYPYVDRFYIPDDVKKIKKGSINAIVTNYRMDSGIAKSSEQEVSITGAIEMGGAGVSASVTSGASSKKSSGVKVWGGDKTGYYQYAPTQPLEDILDYLTNGTVTGWDYQQTPDTTLPVYAWKVNPYSIIPDQAAIIGFTYPDSHFDTFTAIDLYLLNHDHDIDHYHMVEIDWRHTHTANMSGIAAAHQHPLDEGIKVSATLPEGVIIKINGNVVGNTMGSANAVQNNIDILKYVQKGWNTIEVSSTTVARITVYGIIEVSTKTY
jgi:hypothetical protein